MADVDYDYVIVDVCPYDVVEPERLKIVDIPGSSPPITSADLVGIWCDGDPQNPEVGTKCYVRYDGTLTSGDETQLGVVMAAHDGRTKTDDIDTKTASVATTDKLLLQTVSDPTDESVAFDRDVTSRMTFADSENTTPVTLSEIISGVAGHHGQHENGGADEVSVAGLSGVLDDAQTPTSHASSHQNGGSDEINVGALSGVLADAQTPVSHAPSHQNGGADEINVGALSGVLADRQDADKIQGRNVLDSSPAKYEVLEWDYGDTRWESKPNPGSWQQYAYTEAELQTTSGDPQDAQSTTTPTDLPTCDLEIICSILAYATGASCEIGLRLIRDTTVICEIAPIQAVGANVRLIATRIGVDSSISGEHTYKVQYWKDAGSGTARVSHRFLAVRRF